MTDEAPYTPDSAFNCANCHAALPESLVNRGETACPHCGTVVMVHVFPAMSQPVKPSRVGEPMMVENESSCYSHASKRAEQVCDSCGRFVCALCDLKMGDRHICPACLEKNIEEQSMGTFVSRRVHHDSIALWLTLAPLPLLTCFWFLAIILAPLMYFLGGYAIFLGIRHWRTPQSVVKRRRWRFLLAAVLAVLQITVWTVMLVYMINMMITEFSNF